MIMRELEERGKCQALLFLPALGSSFHGFSVAVQLYWPFMIQQFCVSSSCWDLIWFYNGFCECDVCHRYRELVLNV